MIVESLEKPSLSGRFISLISTMSHLKSVVSSPPNAADKFYVLTWLPSEQSSLQTSPLLGLSSQEPPTPYLEIIS